MKTILFIAAFLMAFTPAENPPHVTAYLKSIQLDVEFISALYGIPKQLIYAQSAQESKWGTYDICRDRCNWFGVKENGDYKYYDSKVESFIHYAKILNSGKCYQNLQPQSVDEWLDALDCCHYASDENYTKSLKIIIDNYIK